LIRKAKEILILTVIALSLTAPHALGQVSGTSEKTPRASVTPSKRVSPPKGAEVYFHYPLDGIRVPKRFTVRIGMRGLGVAPAGVNKPNTGHHHVLVDTDMVDFDNPIPSDLNHIHLGNGQTEVVLTLPTGWHTLQLLVGDHSHIPHKPPVISKKIRIYVR
jgi:hypothetical protein